MSRITIFHYHLLPGGVTNVILLGVKSLILNASNLESIRIVCGKAENTNIIEKKLLEEIKKSGKNIFFEIRVEPTIDYLTNNSRLNPEKIEALALKLHESYGDSFWWIHNYHLGKNPLFTAAVIHTAKQFPEQRILLHIHDFPECARYDNLDKLFLAGIKNPYPVTKNIDYALINSRDKKILEEAGIPSEKLFLLNNPVEDDSIDSIVMSDEKKIELKTAFFKSYHNDFPGLKPDGKILFYPVRTIRRKNVFEAGLIAALSNEPINLVLSLPGISDSEKKYSELCEKTFKEGLIPGIWGSGMSKSQDVPSYPQMLKLCDMIISSSVQEGFGYLFINSVTLGTPVVARNLDILDGIKDFFPEQHCFFYNNFFVPISGSKAETLKEAYKIKIKKLGKYLSEKAVESISKKIELLSTDKIADFSFLSVEEQVDILKKVSDSPDLKMVIHNLNEETMNFIYKKLNEGKYNPISAEHFSLKKHAETIAHILNNKYSENIDIQNKQDIQQNLLDRFAEPEYMRLLYEF
ncbi:MAG: hypothetical protein PQJ46_01175 [Spirochaetales bacterium]|nr:hypothetical protein [Spirochaetales bacterium]